MPMGEKAVNADNLLANLICPKHPSNELSLDVTNLECTQCSGVIAIVKNFKPLKVDFTCGFDSGLLTNHNHFGDVSKWTNWRRENLEFLLKMNIKSGRVLDIGAGPGDFHPFLNLNEIISIDFTDYHNTNIITDLNFNIPIKSECIDSIIMTNLLEHLPDTKVLKESYRVLKNGSNIYITVPFMLDVHQIPYDYHRYTYLYLTKILQDEGFNVDQISSSGDFGTFQTLVEHYFRFPISQGSLTAKTLWQFQKAINYLLKKLITVNYRMDYTGGYMIKATKL